MSTMANHPACWTAAELEADKARWVFRMDERARNDLLTSLKKAYVEGKHILDYRKEDFAPGAAWPVIAGALEQAKRIRGVALIKGLPREGVSEDQFRVLTWLIGLHCGVARPQGKASQYMSEVRDAGTDYRTGTGRGYSSNAELDFHTDSADMVFLSCYNRAREGGMSITTSSPKAYQLMREQHPELAVWLHEPVHFSRQGEQAPDEAPTYPHPIFDEQDGKLFSKWNWNRVTSAQKIEGVPKTLPEQQQALDTLDALVRQPALAHTMWLEPGDLQIINSHTTLHSRTEFVDYDEPARKRLLFRLWITPPDSDRLPDSWKVLFKAVGSGEVRGGITGQAYDDKCRAYEQRQARAMGMKVTDHP
jgi:hypothetical protein